MAERPLPGDQARVTVTVAVAPDEAFRIFTEEIDLWWRRGLKYRVAGKHRGIICIEPGVGGRLFESFDSNGNDHVAEMGRVTCWNPPSRLVFEWRAVNFAPTEKTEVEVVFEPPPGADATKTQVTVTHRGWADIRPDHPARHGHEAATFIRMNGMWWGDLMTSLRQHVISRARME